MLAGMGGAAGPLLAAAVTNAGGIGTIGGAAAKVAQDYIKKIEIVEYPEFGMEAVWKIEVEKFPAFVVIDNKGNDFFEI